MALGKQHTQSGSPTLIGALAIGICIGWWLQALLAQPQPQPQPQLQPQPHKEEEQQHTTDDTINNKLDHLEELIEKQVGSREPCGDANKQNTGNMGRNAVSLSFPGERVEFIRSDCAAMAVHTSSDFFIASPSDSRIENIYKYLLRAEKHVIKVFDWVLSSEPCASPLTTTQTPGCVGRHPRVQASSGETRAVVVDIGSNSGFYSLLSASFGWPVVAFDPQPHCQQFIQAAVALSGMDDRVSFVNAFVKHQPTPPIDVLPRTGCWGTFPYNADGVDDRAQEVFADLPQSNTPVSVPSVTIDHQFSPDTDLIVLMKVDTEGHEKEVFEGARKMLEAKRILNIMVEIGKPQLKRAGTTNEEEIEMLEWFMDAGYELKNNMRGPYERQSPCKRDELGNFFGVNLYHTTDWWIYLPEQ